MTAVPARRPLGRSAAPRRQERGRSSDHPDRAPQAHRCRTHRRETATTPASTARPGAQARRAGRPRPGRLLRRPRRGTGPLDGRRGPPGSASPARSTRPGSRRCWKAATRARGRRCARRAATRRWRYMTGLLGAEARECALRDRRAARSSRRTRNRRCSSRVHTQNRVSNKATYK